MRGRNPVQPSGQNVRVLRRRPGRGCERRITPRRDARGFVEASTAPSSGPLLLLPLPAESRHSPQHKSPRASSLFNHPPIESAARSRVPLASTELERQARQERAPSFELRKYCGLRNVAHEARESSDSRASRLECNSELRASLCIGEVAQFCSCSQHRRHGCQIHQFPVYQAYRTTPLPA